MPSARTNPGPCVMHFRLSGLVAAAFRVSGLVYGIGDKTWLPVLGQGASEHQAYAADTTARLHARVAGLGRLLY